MQKKMVAIIGLIGGILAIAGLALAWVSASVSVLGYSASYSGSGLDALSAGYAPTYLVLIGGILALVGGICMIATKVNAIGFLLPIGGILALAGGIWGFAQISEATGAIGAAAAAIAAAGGSASAGAGYGIYICIVGAVIALVSFALGRMGAAEAK